MKLHLLIFEIHDYYTYKNPSQERAGSSDSSYLLCTSFQPPLSITWLFMEEVSRARHLSARNPVSLLQDSVYRVHTDIVICICYCCFSSIDSSQQASLASTNVILALKMEKEAQKG